MKLAIIAAVSLAAVAAPALAQDHAGHTMPAAAPATATAGTAAKFTLDTPLETIVADPKGKAVIDADLPGVTSHEMYEMFKGMTLNQLAPMSEGKITPEALQKTAADLAAIK